MWEFEYMSKEEFIDNIRTLKAEYQKLLVSFFSEEDIRWWRNKVYSFEWSEKKNDRIWEALNGDITIKEMKAQLKLPE